MADVEALIRRGDAAFNDRDEAAARSVMADNVTMRGPGMPPTTGVDAAIQFDKVWWDACSDARSEITHLAVNGDTALSRGIFRGTHDGVLRTPMGEIEPTGKTIEGTYVWLFRVAGDKVVEAEILFDRMQLMEQLGLVPQEAAV